jgi:hypothetical protein
MTADDVDEYNKDLFERLQKELAEYKDTLVIDTFCNIVKLVDVIDGEDDFYWVVKGATYKHISCLMNWTPLKGRLSEEEYEQVLHNWNLMQK